MHNARARLLASTTDTRPTRRAFLGSMAAVAAAPSIFAQGGRSPLPVTALNHMTLSVTDIGRSLEFYQGLFGMPIAARQANTLVLRIGNGPQFLALSGGNANASRSINHLCLTIDDFDADRVVRVLGEHGVTPADGGGLGGGPMRVRVRQRGEEFGGALGGTPELYVGDPDGVVVQIQDSRYCGGRGVLGEVCDTVEPVSSPGVFTLRDLNDFTLFVSDQGRSIAFYQALFGMPINRYQGALPVLSVGSGSQFLALVQVPAPPNINHACLTIEGFQHEEVMAKLETFGIAPRDDNARGPVPPLRSYVTMRMEDRGGAPGGTPELYFTDPDGILIQVQDAGYCGGSGYLGDGCG
jgi:catechol 2,3-dioxygenase-like lactoylglutathione lyase family enzyme